MAFAAVTILMDTLNQNFLQPKPRLTLRNKRKVATLYRNLCFFQTSLQEHSKQVCKYDDEELKSLEAQLRDVSVELRFQIERQLSLFYLGRSMKLRLESAQQLLPILNRAIKQGLETVDADLLENLFGKHLMLPVSRMPADIKKRVKSVADELVSSDEEDSDGLHTSGHEEECDGASHTSGDEEYSDGEQASDEEEDSDGKQLSDDELRRRRILVEAKNLITQELMRTSYLKKYMKQRIKALQRLRQIFRLGIKLTNPMKKKVSLKVKDANDHSKNNAQKHNTSHSLGVLERHWKVAVGASLQHTTKMVGRDDEFKTIVEKLKPISMEREIVPIVGMGGIGKTTMARRIYDDESMISHFDCRAWATVSQQYNPKEVFQDLLRSLSPEKMEIDEASTDKLRELVRKSLMGRRYLIVIDDIWSTKVWDDLQQCFPDNGNGSRMLLTTRLKKVAEYACPSSNFHHNMGFLDSEESWNLFYNKVSKRITFTTEFETISREIVDKCKGLPLAISVAAGLLSNSSQTLNEWQHIAKNVSTLSLDHSEEQCGNIIDLSYTSLPHHLKPCFLSLGVFPEDHECDVDEIIDLWISEGFLKVERCKSLEDVARECVQDLVDRNLVQSEGEIPTYTMHDVLRELAIREAERENYLYRKEDDAIRLEHKRIQSIHCCPPKAQQGTIRSRTCLNDFSIFPSLLWIPGWECKLPSSILVNANFKLLRVLKVEITEINNPIVLSEIMGLVHLRCLTLCTDFPLHLLPLFMLWNLKKLVILGADLRTQIPSQLMYLRLDCVKLVPPKSVQYNLESVIYLDCMSCTGELFLMIPNLKKLGVCTVDVPGDIDDSKSKGTIFYWFESLVYLRKLQELDIWCKILGFGTIHSMGISSLESFLPNLKKLTLKGTDLEWKDMDVVGTLPKLEDLKLTGCAVRGPKWEPIDGGFRTLKYLDINVSKLQYWEATSDHFPVLEHLTLCRCWELEDIPRDFADIGTLQSIKLLGCSESAMDSAKYIEEEMKEFGNDEFVLQIES